MPANRRQWHFSREFDSLARHDFPFVISEALTEVIQINQLIMDVQKVNSKSNCADASLGRQPDRATGIRDYDIQNQ
jgi:hypothetical protein